MNGSIIQFLASLRKKRTTTRGVRVGGNEITECDISTIKTVPIHRASEIQHDVEEYMKLNTSRFGKIIRRKLKFYPSTDEIATPIYVITIIGRNIRKICYIGQASSSKNRFSGGYGVLLKLLNPKYKYFDKYISFCFISIKTIKSGRIPIEWVESKKLRKEVINDVEHALIWKFQPRLNSNLKKIPPVNCKFTINFLSDSNEYFSRAAIRIRLAHNPIVKLRPSIT